MEIIKTISEKIDAELQDAECYIELAHHWKTEQPEAAQLFFELAKSEVEHQNKLHEHAARLINKYKAEHGEPPKAMLAVYSYLHDRHTKRAAEVSASINLFQQ